jgi:hypothetical protein
MKPAPCPRLFEAEAMRDGRLAGAERESFARHTGVCPTCRREVEALDELAEALRAGTRATTDELHTLRERTRLVAAFDATLTGPEDLPGDRARVWRRALWPAAAAALVAGVLLFARSRPAPMPGASPGLVVEAGAAAVWSKRSDGNVERVVLTEGELRIRVDHSRHQAKLIVALPDGELEDTGTTFTVSVVNGRTARVAVQEGSVVVRISGVPPAVVDGGGVWIPPPPRQAAFAPTDAPSAAKPPPPRARSPIVPRAAMARPVDAAATADPGSAFRAAVAVLEAGAHREAAAAFARFLEMHPRDPRAEDAAYLRVIALERCGAVQDTRRAAQAYLQLYPTGFRRIEIEKLAQTSRAERVP